MKFLTCLAVLSLLAANACVPPPPAEEVVDTTAEDRAALNGMIEPYVAAYNAADVESVLAFYDEQVVRMPPNAPSTVGHAGLRLALEETFALGTPEISILQDELIVSGEIAFGRGNYTVTITPEDGDPTVLNGKYLNVSRKLPDGSWKIARAMFNSNDPLPD